MNENLNQICVIQDIRYVKMYELFMVIHITAVN
jgi:hypothetical protein